MADRRKNLEYRETFETLYNMYLEFLRNETRPSDDQLFNNDLISITFLAAHNDKPSNYEKSKEEFAELLRKNDAVIVNEKSGSLVKLAKSA